MSGRQAVLAIPGVHLWNGKGVIPIFMRPERSFWWDGEAVDEISSRFGVRTFSVDPRGIFLNGTSHPSTACPGIDFKGIGNAIRRSSTTGKWR